LPVIFQGKVNTYVKESDSNNIESTNDNSDSVVNVLNWYIKYYGLFLKWIAYSFVIILYFKGNLAIEKSRILRNLFCFSMLYYGFANIANGLPQGVRFYTIGYLLIFFLIIYYSSHSKGLGEALVNKLNIILVPTLLLLIIVSIRVGFDYLGIVTIIGNPFIAPFIEYDMPLIDLIK
jgi:hypothetical protein